MNKKMIIGILFIGITSQVNAKDHLKKITFLGNNQYTIKHADVASEYLFDIDTYNLDAHKNLEIEISSDLPKDPVEAQRIANKRIAKLDQAEVLNLFKGTMLMFQWDIKKIPAFVFEEGKYVIYGVTDTSTAIKRYVNSRKW
jgi:integrating conjugative element protein (TIGR03757 family)